MKSSAKENMNQAGVNMEDNQPEADTRIRANQEKLAVGVLLSQQTLATELKPHCDFIVCGSGFSDSVVQRRLAENSGVRVLMLKADGTDEYRMS
jgi:choline dehydrogenase